MGYPGGYCDKPCATDGDCPLDSVCAATRCRRKCVDSNNAPEPTKCRQFEGYTCRVGLATAPFCDLPGSGS
jgi:hypothetical protein